MCGIEYVSRVKGGQAQRKPFSPLASKGCIGSFSLAELTGQITFLQTPDFLDTGLPKSIMDGSIAVFRWCFCAAGYRSAVAMTAFSPQSPIPGGGLIDGPVGTPVTSFPSPCPRSAQTPPVQTPGRQRQTRPPPGPARPATFSTLSGFFSQLIGGAFYA